MLQRLELIGFKSFADKTRFDFARGVTAVVGPNGSGKSNVVDAVKWVLGEQSAKSLRGGEMADVIFNGSTTRKALGLAEVSMTFDNRGRALATEADEVRITRRVYRDGQGEYLINNQLARLRDVKDLFLGSGAGHGAYSVIEQGRVDALLTASPADRRALFEEAAGISRFKAKKLETLRKLERVDADLTRARDILGELEKQLRTLRLQAAKAQRYQEYIARLKELRVGLGRREYAELSGTLADEEQILGGLRADTAAVSGQEQAADERVRLLDDALGAVEGELRHHQTTLADARQQIAAREAEAKSERGRADQLDAELLRLGQQRADLTARLAKLSAELADVSAAVSTAEHEVATEQARAETAATSLAEVTARIAAVTKRSQADRTKRFELARDTARLQAESETLKRELDRLQRELNGKLVEADRTGRRHDALASVIDDLSRTDANVQQKLAGAKQNLDEHVRYRDDLRAKADGLQAELDQLRESRSTFRGRSDVLEGLERSLEGIGAGVREVLRRLADPAHPARGLVVGLVADLLTAPADVAPLIDLALGDAAQRLVVTDPAKLEAVVAAFPDLPGRVGFMPLAGSFWVNPDRKGGGVAGDTHGPRGPGSPNQTCAALVSAPATLVALPEQLLGDVFLVPDLPTALELARLHPRCRFITRSGEVVDADGTVSVGPVVSGGGILSRKSELRDLRERIAEQDARIAELEHQQAAYRRQAEAMDVPVRALETEIAALSGEAGNLQTQLRDQRLERERLAELLALVREEARGLEADVRTVEGDFHERHHEWKESEQAERELETRLAEAEAELKTAERDREGRQAESTAAQVVLSRVSAQLSGLRKKRGELDADLTQGRTEATNLDAAERAARRRRDECGLLTLRATAAAADAYAVKETAERAVAVLSADRDRLRHDRDASQAEAKRLRDEWGHHRDRAHAREMLVRDLTHRRDTLLARIREDYAVDLAEAAPLPAAGTDDDPIPLTVAPDPDAVQEEIDELKRKVAKLGSVNLEALDELAEQEKRETDLRGQHDDLTSAHAKLSEIIAQINADSRKLFTDTLAAVRVHFQDLFRKLFGGGMADVVLEDEADPLESGIDITARPPGKDLRSISLLSGGERTLTAIALLLAIFRSKPSPFCLLDEVDAALDEANTARLAGVLREFLDRSQFIIVTHKKRTMATADVIYGVTMQESGVSKPVSVRFEDWEDPPAKAAA